MEEEPAESRCSGHYRTCVAAASRISALRRKKKILLRWQSISRKLWVREHTLLSMGGKPSETRLSLLSRLYSISGETRSRQNEQNHSPLWGHVCKSYNIEAKAMLELYERIYMCYQDKYHISLTLETRGELGCDKPDGKLWDICHNRGAPLRSGRQHTNPRWGLPPAQLSFPSPAALLTQTVALSRLWFWI